MWTPLGTNLNVSLKNPPAGANYWQLFIADQGVAQHVYWCGEGLNPDGSVHNSINETAFYEIPAAWAAPYRISLGIYHHYLVNGQLTADQLYYVQSLWPEAWGEPDPNYQELFIPGAGTYCFNVITEQFEGASGEVEFQNLAITEFARVGG